MRPHERVVALTCHPATPCDAVRRLEVRVRRNSAAILTLSYSLDADMARLRIPASAAPQRTDGLWRHTCLEAFIRQEGAPGYCEFNFAPSTQWAAYRFTGYREGMMAVAEEHAPRLTVRNKEHGLELDAVLKLESAAELTQLARLLLAGSAVIEEENGRLSYWALKHASGKPDFHHPESFALEL
jgi:hypothetical protein